MVIATNISGVAETTDKNKATVARFRDGKNLIKVSTFTNARTISICPLRIKGEIDIRVYSNFNSIRRLFEYGAKNGEAGEIEISNAYIRAIRETVYRICHFRFPGIPCYQKFLQHPRDRPYPSGCRSNDFSTNFSNNAKKSLTLRDQSRDLKDPDRRKNPIRRKHLDSICWDIPELVCNPRRSILIAFISIVKLLNRSQ